MEKKVKTRIYIFLVIALVLSSVAIASRSSSSLNWLTKAFADTLYASKGDIDKTMYIYLEDSTEEKVIWNITKADKANYTFKIRQGEHFVFGGELQ